MGVPPARTVISGAAAPASLRIELRAQVPPSALSQSLWNIMQHSEKRQKAIDLSHHLSDVALARKTSPLKGLARFFGRPGVISLAGGTDRFIAR